MIAPQRSQTAVFAQCALHEVNRNSLPPPEGTLLAAIGGEVLVALTALAAAVTNKLEIGQVENSLVQYDMALSNLRNVETWRGLSPWKRTRQKNIDLTYW